MVPFAAHGRALASRIPGAPLVTAPDGDHVLVFTHRAMVQRAVVAFLHVHARQARTGDRGCQLVDK